MKRRFGTRASDIKQLEKENNEQLDTIRSLWSDLDLPSGPEILNGQPITPSQNQNLHLRIAELEAILAKKKENYMLMERQISEYVKHAEMYENQLLQNEEEKARLLLSFQNGAGNSTSELGIDELESQIEEMQHSYNELKEEKEAVVKMCRRYGSKLKNSKEKLSSLLDEKRRLASYSSFGAGDFQQILSDRKATVEELRKRLADCKKVVQNLREDNEMLKNALSSDYSD